MSLFVEKQMILGENLRAVHGCVGGEGVEEGGRCSELLPELGWESCDRKERGKQGSDKLTVHVSVIMDEQ